MRVLYARAWWGWAVRLFLGLLCLGAAGAEPPAPAASTSVALQVFVRDGCPYCADAKAFLDDVQRQRPGLHIVYRPVDTDPAARDELNALSRAHGAWPPGVPAFHTAGQLIVGFESPETTGQEVLRPIDAGTAANHAAVPCAPRHAANGIATMHATKNAHTTVCVALIAVRTAGFGDGDG